jgi:hypothetical protein
VFPTIACVCDSISSSRRSSSGSRRTARTNRGPRVSVRTTPPSIWTGSLTGVRTECAGYL